MMMQISDPYSSQPRPVLTGSLGAVSAAHPLAVAAGQEMLLSGGSAADAMIAAQAALCVLAPDACGLGGDMLALVRAPGAAGPIAVNGTGRSPAAMTHASDDGPHSITIPGIADAWVQTSMRWGRLSLAHCLQPAIRLARRGFPVTVRLAATVDIQRQRLMAGGAETWSLLHLPAGAPFVQEALAGWLVEIGANGRAAFYAGRRAEAMANAVQRLGGVLAVDDFEAHESVIAAPILGSLADVRIAVQPPATQGVLLAMVLKALGALGAIPRDRDDHALIELTEAAFTYRSRAGEGAALLDAPLPVDMQRAMRRGGPRAYLHTAGVAVADAQGMVCSSLVSVFDDFGSAVFVPECGVVLNNRAGGFTDGPNSAAPAKRPVHTLAPAMAMLPSGDILALATPGADGQIQTLAQIFTRMNSGESLSAAIHAPRWRTETGELLIERGHPQADILASLGHHLRVLEAGDTRFGAVVAAGMTSGSPFCAADWRRETWAGVA